MTHRDSTLKKAAAGLLLCAILFSGVALAEADGPDFYQVHGVAENDTLNIHKEPHAKSKVIGEVGPHQECLKNLGCKGGLTMDESMTLSKEKQAEITKKRPRWCKVDFDGVQGWVYAQYVREGSCTQLDNYKMK